MFHFPPRLILAAVDEGPESLRAYKAAKLVAEKFGARLEAFHCLAPLPSEVAAYPERVERERRLERSEALRKRFPDADSLHVTSGDPARVMARLARDRGADLVVVGTHGRRGAQRALLGSVAEEVLRHSPVPVLVIRRGFKAPERVLAPIQEDDGAALGLDAAALVARAFGARLEVLHVVTDPVFGVSPGKLIETRLRKLPGGTRAATHATAAVRSGRPVAEIVKAARASDLVVLVERSKSALEDFFVGTTAERVCRRAPVPLLAIPAKRR